MNNDPAFHKMAMEVEEAVASGNADVYNKMKVNL